MKKLLAGAFALTLILGACGGDKKDDDKADSKTTTTASLKSAALDAKLLTLADLPDGFEATSSSEDSGDPTCDAFKELKKDIPATHQANAAFQALIEGDDNSIALVFQSINEYDDEDEAKEATDRAKEALDGECSSFTDDNGGKTTLKALDGFDLGDQSFAHSLTISAEDENGKTVNVDGAMFVIRDGVNVARVMLAGAGQMVPGAEDYTAVTNAAAAKL